MNQRTIECRGCRASVTYEPVSPQPAVYCHSCGSLVLGDPSIHSQSEAVRRMSEPGLATRPSTAPEPEYDTPRREPRVKSGNSALPWILAGVGLALLLVIGLPLALLLPAISKVRTAAARMTSANNMKQIGLAFHNVNDSQGNLPGDILDRDGRPVLSWRVAILPAIEQDNLYRQFRLDEPWDGPNNIRLLRTMPKTYLVPGRESEAAQGRTYYQGFAGPGTVFDPRPGHKLDLRTLDGQDGIRNTILVVEAGDSVEWTKPGGLPFDPDGPLPALGDHFGTKGFSTLFADGSVRFTANRQANFDAKLRAAITYNGGEKTDLD